MGNRSAAVSRGPSQSIIGHSVTGQSIRGQSVIGTAAFCVTTIAFASQTQAQTAPANGQAPDAQAANSQAPNTQAPSTQAAEASTDSSATELVTVTGTAPGKLLQDTPQSVNVVTQATMQQEGTTRLVDALRNVPGITINSGEGGAHGDTVNLRGFALVDNFYLDGLRDPGSYTRDSFDLESVEVLKGPSGVLFGHGSAGGVANQITKTATLAPEESGTVAWGTNHEYRATADLNQPLSDTAAIRVNLMGEQSDVTDRDDVQNKRWGGAASLALGINQPTSFTLDYLHQEEDNIPDYGIPFLFGSPVPVPRQTFYGLVNDDKTQTNVNIMTAKLTHQFNDNISVSDTVRYGNYWLNYRITGPHFNDGSGGTETQPIPTPGTPLDTIVIYRDRPSSEGTQTDLQNDLALTAKFATGFASHYLIAGIETERETLDLTRYANQIAQIPGTPILNPNPNQAIPGGTQTTITSLPNVTTDDYAAHLIDTITFTPQWSLVAGVRVDDYQTDENEEIKNYDISRDDKAFSPRAAILFAPDETQTYYLSYAKSFDPAASYLTGSVKATGVTAPETSTNYEIGAKSSWLDGMLTVNAAVFRTQLTNAHLSDPDIPSLQLEGGLTERVVGGEIDVSGYITPEIEINAGYTYIDPKIVSSADPNEEGKLIPNTARSNATLWVTYEPTQEWQVGGGMNYLGRRYADPQNTASVPSYVVFNAMAHYQLTDNVGLQINVDNITDKMYYDAVYYSNGTENHAIPGAGRTVMLQTVFNF